MVEQALNTDYVERQAAESLISSLYPQIINEQKLEPVDYPDIQITQMEEGKPFAFKVAVEVYPEVKLGKYKGLKAEKPDATVTEEEVLALLGRMQERLAVTKEGGEKELLSLDDEFAKKVSALGTLAELKAELHKALLQEKTAKAEAVLKDQLVAAVVANAKLEMPEALIDREVAIMLNELETSLSQSGLSLEDYLKGSKKEKPALKSEMRPAAEVRAKGKVVLKAISEAEQLTITPEEYNAEVAELARSTGKSLEEARKLLGENGDAYINEYLTRKKALDWLAANAEVKIVAEPKGEKK
jgi:trigger factor